MNKRSNYFIESMSLERYTKVGRIVESVSEETESDRENRIWWFLENFNSFSKLKAKFSKVLANYTDNEKWTQIR